MKTRTPEPQRARPPRCEAAPPIIGRLSGRPTKGSSKRPGTASTSLNAVPANVAELPWTVYRRLANWSPGRRVVFVKRRCPPRARGASHETDATLQQVHIHGDDRLRRGWLVWMVASRGPGRPRKTPGKTISANSHEYALAA